MKNYLFFSMAAIIACNILAADSSSNHSSGQSISDVVEAKDYIVFDKDTCLFSEKEIKELDEVIELIGTRDRYKNGDGGETHTNAHYGTIAFEIIGTNGGFIEKDATWISFEKSFKASYLEEEIFQRPIIETLFRRIASALRTPPSETGCILKLKLVCSHEESHPGLRKHQDNVNYLFTLITNAKDIAGGEMYIYQLNEKGRDSLKDDKYYYGENAKKLYQEPARKGAGYVIKELPDTAHLIKNRMR